jgi:hypothetical protein
MVVSHEADGRDYAVFLNRFTRIEGPPGRIQYCVSRHRAIKFDAEICSKLLPKDRIWGY